jgi:hypothetical protein
MGTTNDFTGQSSQATSSAKVRHTGGCHCGAVRFEAEFEAGFCGSRCNCSICQKLGATGAILKPSAFRLLSGDESLGSYTWGARVSTRHFCTHCGVYCFGAGQLAELGGDFTSVNLNCLDEFDVNEIEIIHWDGRHNNWMAGPRKSPWPLFAGSDTAENAHEPAEAAE